MTKYQPLRNKGPFCSQRSRILLIFAVISLAVGWTIFHNIDIQSHFDTYISPWNKDSMLKPAVSHLDPNTKYLSYLPFAGLTNQFIGLEIAAYAAKQLNRTLILPPIISNSHDHENTHQRWSRFLDLRRFTELTGIPVLEWDTVRPLDAHQHQAGQDYTQIGRFQGSQDPTTKRWNSVAENITCQIIYGYGAPNINVNISGLSFLWHFLFRPIFVDPPPRKSENPTDDFMKYAKDTYHRNVDVFVMDDLVARYSDYDDNAESNDGGHQILLLGHTFKIKNPGYTSRYWTEIGQHLHFVPQVMEYVAEKLNEEFQDDQGAEVLPNDDPEEVLIETNSNENIDEIGDQTVNTTEIKAPRTRIPHIAVHLRRGDIWMKCSEANRISCLLPFDYYARAVQRARAVVVSSPSLSINAEHMPVIVTTDTDSEDDLRQIKEHGWHLFDHEKHETVRIWGSFGPAMIDSAILAHADVLVGSGKSTMSRVAAERQKDWYKHETIYPEEINTKQKRTLLTRRSSNGMRKRRMDVEEEEDERPWDWIQDDDVVLVY
ncbi:hypothetical protein BGZ51_007382 [Haplosporangium sp. Z 767]|nr:hypothetical protein BGZ51_007382 [Haplosporangium sp. Z 767]KAF9191269.1 hypothetical protein BGZ50_009484 [Haplosporangium sp. Z 11]